MADHVNSNAQTRILPVVRWLQMGAVAAGVGMAFAVAPAIASADGGSASSTADSSSASASTARSGAPQASAHRASVSASRTTTVLPSRTATVLPSRTTTALPRAGRSDGAQPAASTAPRQRTVALPLSGVKPAAQTPVAAATTASATTNPFGKVSAFLGLPGAPATAAPTIGAISLRTRLVVDDIFSGTGPAKVTNPTAVVTGLFNEVLRADPTADELQNYLNVLRRSGVNGVVAGLYSSTAFRQSQVNNYYLELVGRNATQQELSWKTSALVWGLPEPMLAGEIAGTTEFYQASGAGGGTFGTQPSATTFVNLLYRTLLGEAADPTASAISIQHLQAGQRRQMAARQFVTTDAFREVKVGEVYQVIGQTPTQGDLSQLAGKWFLNGGLAGIATGLLATSTNVQRIETGQVTTPDTVAAAKLKQLLLASYTDGADGFVKLFNRLLSLDPGNPISETNPCTAGNTSCDQALYRLITTGGTDRGIPNSSLTLTSITANVATLVPTQNEIDLKKSLKFPLQDPAQLQTFFTGGIIQPFGSPVVTANNGTYILDGHHRWSGIVLINPYTQVTALDLGYVPMPQNGLEEAQMGVAAAKGYLAVAEGGGINLYDCTQETFNVAVRGYIETAQDGHKDENGNPIPPPNPPGGTWTDQVLAVFGKNLGFDPSTTPLDEQYSKVQNYLWGNVLRMRESNPFIPGATSRAVMPQTDPLPLVQTYLASGALSYSFPTISYLG